MVRTGSDACALNTDETAAQLLSSLEMFAKGGGGFKLDLTRPGCQPSPTVPKIPNFSRAISGSSASSLPSSGSASGSLSARERASTAPFSDADARRPLTSRPAASLGVTTPRGTAMVGPRPGDRSMRGMDSLLAAYRDQPLTPRSMMMVGASPASAGGASFGGGDGAPLTPRSPRSSPRGTGALSARKRGDDCVRAPPPLRTPKSGEGGRANAVPRVAAAPPQIVAAGSFGAPPAPPTTPVRGGVSKEAVRDVMAKVEELSRVVRALELDGGAVRR